MLYLYVATTARLQVARAKSERRTAEDANRQRTDITTGLTTYFTETGHLQLQHIDNSNLTSQHYRANMSGQNSTTNKKDEAKTAAPAEAAPAVEAIEEDDEFEEFEPCHWDVQDEDAEDAQQWQVRQ